MFEMSSRDFFIAFCHTHDANRIRKNGARTFCKCQMRFFFLCADFVITVALSTQQYCTKNCGKLQFPQKYNENQLKINKCLAVKSVHSIQLENDTKYIEKQPAKCFV